MITFPFFFCFLSECNDNYVFCGIKDKLYPDERSMGFPFDRTFDKNLFLQDFVASYDNMQKVGVKITHNDANE
jgi:tyrosinase